MRAFVLLLLVAAAAATEEEFLSAADRRALEELREGFVEEVGGFEAGKGQPYTLLLTFQTGTRAICKARPLLLLLSLFLTSLPQNGRLSYWKMDQLVNEVFVFYLDRLLRMGLVPPATISVFSGLRFRQVRDNPLLKKHWHSGDPLVCSLFVDEAVPAVWPALFLRQKYQINVPAGEAKGWSAAERRAAEQWGMVVAFDYLTGNTERLAASLSTSAPGFLPRSKRKIAALSLGACRHADCRVENAWTGPGGALVLTDNNSGFFFDRMGSLQEPLEWMLEDTCVFPAAFLAELARPGTGGELRAALVVLVNRNEPEGPALSGPRAAAFRARYQTLVEHLLRCRAAHSGRLSFFP